MSLETKSDQKLAFVLGKEWNIRRGRKLQRLIPTLLITTVFKLLKTTNKQLWEISCLQKLLNFILGFKENYTIKTDIIRYYWLTNSTE